MNAAKKIKGAQSPRKTSDIVATGLKPPVAHAPKRLATTADVVKLQRLMTHALIRPLTADDQMEATWIDGRPMAELAAEFIKPNDRLAPFERLQLYNRMYWFRVIDAVYEDNPGLHALIGEKTFSLFVRAYLAKYPSRSFTMRNLCSRLEQFIREEPRWTRPHTTLARELARFAWAQTVAFDSATLPVITPEQIAATPPARLRLSLQPFITLLAVNHAVDDYVIAVKTRQALRSEASNTSDSARHTARAKKIRRPGRERIWIAVHRQKNLLYYKRLDRPAFLILQALQAGRPLAAAIAAGGRRVTAQDVQTWFAMWMELGWLCRWK